MKHLTTQLKELRDPDEQCQSGDDGDEEIKRFGNNKKHETKIKRRAIAMMVKKSKRVNRNRTK